MRVLIANKYFYPRGGAEKSTFLADAMLRGAGHETIHFSTRDPRNRESPWSGHFLPAVEHGKGALHPASSGAIT